MPTAPSRLRPPWTRRLPWIVALVAAAGSVVLSLEPVGRPDATGLDVDAKRTEALETGWIDAVLGRAYLAVPPPEAPCPEGLRDTSFSLRRQVSDALGRGDLDALRRLHAREPDHWLPGTVLALSLVGRGDAEEATAVVDRVVGGRRVPARVAAALAGEALTGRDREEALGTVQLLHLHGWLLLARGRYGADLWRSQRSAIVLGSVLAGPDGRLPAPGCARGPNSLSEPDLRNNLLVAYLTAPGIEGEVRDVEEDLAGREDGGPFAAVLAVRGTSGSVRSEGWWRAVGLAGPLAAGLEAPGSHPRAALNLAQLALEAVPLLSGDDRERLLTRTEEWWEGARRGVVRLPAGAREPFVRVLDRATLVLGVARGRPMASPRDPEVEVAELTEALEAAWRWRRSPERWLAAALEGDPELGDVLGSRTEAWRKVGRLDLALALARRSGDPGDGRAILRADDPAPQELEALEAGRGGGLSTTSRIALRALVAAVSAFVLALVLRRLFEPALDLTTSHYRLEARRRLEERLR